MRILPALPLLALSACGYFGASEMSFYYQEKVIDRREALSRLRFAVRANMATCPENNAAGLYAIEQIIPAELKHSHYYADSVEKCAVACLVLPCGATVNQSVRSGSVNKDDNVTIFLPILRACNLQFAGIDF